MNDQSLLLPGQALWRLVHDLAPGRQLLVFSTGIILLVAAIRLILETVRKV